MPKRALTVVLMILTALALTISSAAAEGYMMVFGSLTVFGDRELTSPLGEIRDASVVYVPFSEDTGDGRVLTVVFGDRWVLRTGYAPDGALMPLMPFEEEAYILAAKEGMSYTSGVHLLNADFSPAWETDTARAEDSAAAGEEIMPTRTDISRPEADLSPSPTGETRDAAGTAPAVRETVTPLPAAGYGASETAGTERPVPTPLPTVTPRVTREPATPPPTPTKDPSSCVDILVPPTDVGGFSGEEVVLAVGATGAASYRWQYFDGSEWTDSVMEQASSSAMKLVVFEGGRERIYRCVIKGTDGTEVYTDPVRIIVQK